MSKSIVLITGVSRREGLGYETARQLISNNYDVIISARQLEKAKVLADEISARAVSLDVTDEASILQLEQFIRKEYGQLDVLINNAGAFFDMGQQPLDAEMSMVQAAMDLNLMGAWRMIKAFVPLLKESNHPRIVNVSSGAGSFQDPIFGLSNHMGIVPVYGISKLALNGLTVKIARQLAETSIKINSVCPGFVATYPGTVEYGARPVTEGAKGIVWAAMIPDDGPSGGFFRDGEAIAW